VPAPALSAARLSPFLKSIRLTLIARPLKGRHDALSRANQIAPDPGMLINIADRVHMMPQPERARPVYAPVKVNIFVIA
jgi:hypothetical protein